MRDTGPDGHCTFTVAPGEYSVAARTPEGFSDVKESDGEIPNMINVVIVGHRTRLD